MSSDLREAECSSGPVTGSVRDGLGVCLDISTFGPTPPRDTPGATGPMLAGDTAPIGGATTPSTDCPTVHVRAPREHSDPLPDTVQIHGGAVMSRQCSPDEGRTGNRRIARHRPCGRDDLRH